MGTINEQAEQSKKLRSTKPLPTNRVAFVKQLEIIRDYAAACGDARKAVANKQVADIVRLKSAWASVSPTACCSLSPV